ncbi:MAG: polymerase Rpb6 [Acidobacteriota bacterium]|jgi:DNA-directed RNA polymerase subunit omega|nr:polymerase Rpb6 [Acidobacteriota bacterium]
MKKSRNAPSTTNKGSDDAAPEDQWPGIDSRYRLIAVAALRSKQLQRGASPRIAADPLKRRNTSIALEEVKQGLIHFSLTEKDAEKNGVGNTPEVDGSQ